MPMTRTTHFEYLFLCMVMAVTSSERRTSFASARCAFPVPECEGKVNSLSPHITHSHLLNAPPCHFAYSFKHTHSPHIHTGYTLPNLEYVLPVSCERPVSCSCHLYTLVTPSPPYPTDTTGCKGNMQTRMRGHIRLVFRK